MPKKKEFIFNLAVYHGMPKISPDDTGGGGGGMCQVIKETQVVQAVSATKAMEKVREMYHCVVKIEDIKQVM